jgi:hypothetical protein
MFTCPRCSKANNIYATACQHCGMPLTPKTGPGAPAPPPEVPPCGKCGGGQFLAVSPFLVVDDYQDRLHAMAVLVSKTAGLTTESAGSFRAIVCLSCGFTEFYARDLPALRAHAAKAPNAQVVDATLPAPYR